jgi:hypothetical protein
MTILREIALSESRLGRIKLHSLAMVLDHRIIWHIQGILREIIRSIG